MIKYDDFENLSISDVKLNYSQPDDCEGENGFQSISIESKDAGGGPFARIRIGETADVDYFSVSDISDFFPIFEHFYNTLGVKSTYYKCPPDDLISLILHKAGLTINDEIINKVKNNWNNGKL